MSLGKTRYPITSSKKRVGASIKHQGKKKIIAKGLAAIKCDGTPLPKAKYAALTDKRLHQKITKKVGNRKICYKVVKVLIPDKKPKLTKRQMAKKSLDYSKLSRAQLYKIAKTRKIRGRSLMTKAQLVKCLRDHDCQYKSRPKRMAKIDVFAKKRTQPLPKPSKKQQQTKSLIEKLSKMTNYKLKQLMKKYKVPYAAAMNKQELIECIILKYVEGKQCDKSLQLASQARFKRGKKMLGSLLPKTQVFKQPAFPAPPPPIRDIGKEIAELPMAEITEYQLPKLPNLRAIKMGREIAALPKSEITEYELPKITKKDKKKIEKIIEADAEEVAEETQDIVENLVEEGASKEEIKDVVQEVVAQKAVEKGIAEEVAVDLAEKAAEIIDEIDDVDEFGDELESLFDEEVKDLVDKELQEAQEEYEEYGFIGEGFMGGFMGDYIAGCLECGGTCGGARRRKVGRPKKKAGRPKKKAPVRRKRKVGRPKKKAPVKRRRRIPATCKLYL